MNKASIVFDMDGTLLDSLKDIASNFNSTLAYYGLKTYPISMYREMLGYGPIQTFKKTIPQSLVDDDLFINELVNHFKKTYWENAFTYSTPYEGIIEMLKEIQMKCDLAVFSNKPQALLEYITSHYFSDIDFKYIQGSGSSPYLKPEKESVDVLVKRSGFSKENILFVGDTVIDAKTAKAANLKSVGVTWGMGNEEDLVSLGMTSIVNTVDELKKLILQFSFSHSTY
ncbi:MAG: HAD family hydrolase [Pleomorphochaeta sp.]